MGNGRMDARDFDDYSRRTNLQTSTREQLFQQSSIHPSLDPRAITVRESRDSPSNPNSTAVAIFGDHTGSMGQYAESMLKDGINRFFQQMYEKVPVPDPHLMFGLYGDLQSDQAPLEVSQFEADTRILDQLRLGFLEGNGGGNHGESGSLPWFFMANFTSIDCWERRQKKGYLFTYSDEPIHPYLDPDLLRQKVFGRNVEGPYDSASILRRTMERYEVYHVVVAQGGYCQRYGVERAATAWRQLLGSRVIVLEDVRRMPEVLIATIQLNEGVSRDSVIGGFDSESRATVERSIGDLGRRLEL